VRTPPWWIAILLGLLLALISSWILDIAMGEKMSLECVVEGRYYVPPKTTVTTDSEGDISIDTDPEEFHIKVSEVNDGSQYDIKTSHYNYSTLTNQQPVRVRASLGKWTRATHIIGIE
jgi:hypothetical protein